MKTTTPVVSKRRNLLSHTSLFEQARKVARVLLPKALTDEDEEKSDHVTQSRNIMDCEYSDRGRVLETPRTPSMRGYSNRRMDLSTSVRGSAKSRRSSYCAAYMRLSAKPIDTPREVVLTKKEMENVLPYMVLDPSLQRARSRILTWLLASVLSTECQISTYTFYLATSLYDKYMLSKLVAGVRPATLKQEVEILAMTALFVASKMEDYDALYVDDIFNIFQSVPLKRSDVLDFEKQLLSEVDFEVHNTYTDLIQKAVDSLDKDLAQCVRLLSLLLTMSSLSISVNQQHLAEETLRLMSCIVRGQEFVFSEKYILIDHLCLATLGIFMKYRVDKESTRVTASFELCWRLNKEAYQILKTKWPEFQQQQQTLRKQRSIRYLVNRLARCNAF